MSRKFTAEEMRELASVVLEDVYGNETGGAVYPLTSKFDENTIAEMLRQAADDMEREKKYEYATKWDDGKIDGISPCKDEVTDSISFVQYISSISADNQTGCKLVRREVGEWEEVPNEG